MPPLIVHIVHSLAAGGMENGLINLINQIPDERYRHAIICLTQSGAFAQRLKKPIEIIELNKQPGQDWGSFIRCFRALKRLRPDIVHTRNLTAIEYQLPAWLVGVKYRIQGEHGWDKFDPYGDNKKYQWLRRLMNMLIHRFVPLSSHLQCYLTEKVGIPECKIRRIINGVDTGLFFPGLRLLPAQCPLKITADTVVIGTVGRLQDVKAPQNLARALALLNNKSELKGLDWKAVFIGDGPLYSELTEWVAEQGLSDKVWLAGRRDDVPECYRWLDVFVLPSKAEGISNSILEAMATGLPVLATEVGGNPELVIDGQTGLLVPKEDPELLADKLALYLTTPYLRRSHGQAGLSRVKQAFAISAMVDNYLALYDEHLGACPRTD